ncbi:hypothetical protein ACF07Y_04455 [Streptomyces sp. NPDC016566]|uniref:hypothetical protein n=1 Tax=unclassified Streptomyces TaxID=2593676 RepID=UPI0036E22C7A
MTNTDHTLLAEPVSLPEVPDAAIAMIDAEGIVVGWTHDAAGLAAAGGRTPLTSARRRVRRP